MKTFSISFFLLLISLMVSNCSSLQKKSLLNKFCNVDLSDSKVLSYYDSGMDFTFRYLDSFRIKTIYTTNGTEYLAVSHDGAFEHSIAFLNFKEDDNWKKTSYEYFKNDSTKLSSLNWRNLYSSELKKDFKFANGIATRKINDSIQINGLFAVDVYEFRKEKQLVIVTATDFCKTTSSNNIEPIFSLNRKY